jgi:exopolysaccharide production protein ExoZ
VTLRLLNLELLRFVAAAWVVTAHTAGSLQGLGVTVPLFGIFSRGWAGVDLFFVISGYVIAHGSLHQPRGIGRFVLQRLIRIVPAYWIVSIALLLVLFASTAAGIPNTSFVDFSPGWLIASLFFVSLPLGFEGPFVYLGWSLEYEMLFYFLFAISMLITSKPAQRIWLAIALVIGVSVVFPGSFLQLEFALGCLVALIARKIPRGRNRGVVFLVSGLASFIVFSVIGLSIPRFLEYGIGFSLIVLGVVLLPQISSKPWKHLGASSYAVYLLQVLTIPILVFLVRQIQGWENWSLPILLAILVLNQVVASIFEKMLDAPLRERLSKTLIDTRGWR